MCSKQTYRYADYATFRALWHWARRRHPKNKNAHWVRKKYFRTHNRRTWTFSGEVNGRSGKPHTLHLFYAANTLIRRHDKITASANPFDPSWELYSEQGSQFTLRLS